MRSARFAAVGERLLDAGIAPRHARRAVLELDDHFDDLVAELESQGQSRDEAEADATARLNPDALIDAAIARPELHSWVRRWPLVSCTALPLGMYMVFVVGSIALLVGGVTLVDHNFGVTLASSPTLQRFAATCLSGVAWAVPIFAAGTYCSIAQARRAPLGWTLLGAVLISLVGAALNAGLVLSPNERPGLQAGFGFSTEVLALPLLRAALTLAIVLPFYFWRLAHRPSPSKLAAVAAVVLLHGAMITLIAARAPRIASDTNDAAMTLVAVRPVIAPPVDIPATTIPPRPRDAAAPLPLLPAEVAPSVEERTPIDFAREAALAARRIVTPEARNLDPGVPRKPPPEFGWSKMANPVEALPEGGMLFRLSERCVLVVSLMVMPACALGEIPANGKLFEHMDDPPTLGDWKDDSALPR